MNRVCNILVIVDPTVDEHPAVDKGALLAEKFDARLELFTCDTKASRNARLAAHASGKPVVLDLKAKLEMLADPLRQRGLDVTTETSRSDPLCEGLIDRTRRTNAELVIKDTHHHSLAQRTLLTNTDWQLIRGCPVPLLLTKPKSWADAPRIVAAVDPGHANDKPVLLDRCILEEAAAVAQRLNGELHVLHVYLPMEIVATATAVPPVALVSPEALAGERQAKLKTISALVSDYKVDVKHIHLEIGGPGAVLPRAAREINADIVAMGAISRSGVKRVFIGSTAEDVLEHLPCDALIVKTPNFAELLPI
jgi:universal stress protein E